ncbi:MAG TPA: tetratricopeptide repeat protein [Leptolyngbyaceae cyanobacterium]
MLVSPMVQIWQKLLSSKRFHQQCPIAFWSAIATLPFSLGSTAALAQTPLLEVTGTLEEGDVTFPEDGTLYDLYTFEGQAGQAVIITLESTEVDAFLLLRDSQEQTIFQNDDVDSNNSNAQIAVVLPETGTYQVVANSYSATDRGSYRLTVTPTQPTDPVLKKFEADELNRQGRILAQQSRYLEALEYYERSLTIYQEIENRIGEGQALNNIGSIYDSLDDYSKALDYYQRSLAIYQFIGDKSGEGNSFNNIGGIYNSLGDYFKALDYYQQSLTVRRSIGDKSGEGQSLNNIGFIYDRLGDYTKALDYYQQSLAIRQAIGDRSGEGNSFNNIGGIYDSLGDYPKALDYYQQSLSIRRSIGDKSGEGNSFNNIGFIYDRLGDYTKALDYYQQSLSIRQSIGDRSGEGTTLNNIGGIYSSLGDYSKALDYYQQSLSIRQSIGDRSGEGATLNNIGSIYDRLGDYFKALDYYQQSLSIRQAIGDKSGEGATLNNIGGTYVSLDDYPKALNYYQQSLSILQAIGEKNGEGTVLNNIGFIHSSLGDYPKALDYYQQSLSILQAIGDKHGEGNSFDNIGSIYDSLGDYPKALDYYQQSLAIRQAIGDKSGEGTTLNNIGRVLAVQNQPELAIVFLKQSVNTYEAIRDSLRSLDQSLQSSYTNTVADTYRTLADLLLQQDRVLEAQRVLDLLKVQELEEYLQDVQRNGNTEEGVPNRPAEEHLENSLNARLNQVITLTRELQALEAIAPNQRTPQQRQRILDLGRQAQELIGGFNAFLQSKPIQDQVALLRQSTDGQSIDLSNFRDLQRSLAALQQNAVLLYPFVLDDRLELVLVTPEADTPIRETVMVDRVTLNQAIANYRSALESPSSNPLPLAQQLYGWLLKPLEDELKTVGAKTIIYAPDSQLRYIPLGALHDGNEWVVQDFRINNITAASLTDLTLLPTQAPQVFAGAFTEGSYPIPVGDRQEVFHGLRFAGKEVDNLATLLPNTTKLLNADFNPDTVSEMNSYNIVHLATHATFVPGDKYQSFILFGDGTPVSLAEVQNWRLPNVDLVVLSACETGVGDELGDGREILGLGYQMQKAGAKAAIASLWSVSDGGTQTLMDAFYGALARSMSKAEALQQAQIALITGDFKAVGDQRAGIEIISTLANQRLAPGGTLAHPYYWAPFILIGNGL